MGFYVDFQSKDLKPYKRDIAEEEDVYADADERFEHTVHGGLDSVIDEFGAVAGAPAVGAVGQPVSDGATGTLVGAAMLAPTGATSMPFGTTGALELGQPELPSMPGWLDR